MDEANKTSTKYLFIPLIQQSVLQMSKYALSLNAGTCYVLFYIIYLTLELNMKKNSYTLYDYDNRSV